VGRRATWRLDELQRSCLAWPPPDIKANAIPNLEAIGASLAGIAAEATAAKSDVSGA
jgi:hypothetical protein